MTTLMQASREWSTRSNEERFVNLPDMAEHFNYIKNHSSARVVSSRKINVAPLSEDNEHKSLVVIGPNGNAVAPTHHAFNQLATLAGAPAGFLRKLPSELAADNLNYMLHCERDIEDVGVLLHQNGVAQMRAATGPNYGRIWNADIVDMLIDRFGDGVTGQFRVPGEFGKAVPVTKATTTLYANDENMFVFLADEEHRISVPNRRNGQDGSLSRGFFVFNSEVGTKRFGLMTFLFDYMCCNHIVWGVQEISEINIRHTASAPDRFLAAMAPALQAFSLASESNERQAIMAAQQRQIGQDKVADFLANRFGTRKFATQAMQLHQLEEGRPIESYWDAVTAATAVARGLDYAEQRVDVGTIAGKILKEFA